MAQYLIVNKIKKKDSDRLERACEHCGETSKFQITTLKIDQNRINEEQKSFVCQNHFIQYSNSYKPIALMYYIRLRKQFDKSKILKKSKLP
jgi:hypothetical protein